jgi:hypothetical protein
MRFKWSAVAAGAAWSVCLAVPALAQSTGLEDMVGARAGQAESELQRRGYGNVPGGSKSNDRSYSYWWNADRGQCVTIATMEGRYASITPTPPPDCRQPANLRSRAPGYPDRPAGGTLVDGRPVDLGLVCFGDGSKNGVASGTRWTWNRDRDRYDYGRYTESTTEVFDASLMVQLWAGGGRIRLPKSLVPPIHSRGDSGWWELTDVRSGPDMITAGYRLNGLNKPRVTIDRRSGRITVQGMASYGFRGTCDTIGDERRRF